MYDLYMAANKKVTKHETELSFTLDLYRSSHSKVDKYETEMNYVIELLKRNQEKIATLETAAKSQPVAAQQSEQMMSTSTNHDEKYQKDIMYLIDLISKKTTALTLSEAEVKKL